MNSPSQPVSDPILSAITQALAGLRYGQVTILVQDGRVMQIDRTDRHRLKASDALLTDGVSSLTSP